jgi:hypothetical protein
MTYLFGTMIKNDSEGECTPKFERKKSNEKEENMKECRDQWRLRKHWEVSRGGQPQYYDISFMYDFGDELDRKNSNR